MLKKAKEVLWDGAAFLAGGLLYRLSVNVFTLPAAIAPAGWAGIGALLHYLFGFPVGLTVLVLNLPLFVLGARTFGKSFLPKTVAATVLSSVLIDLTAPILPSYQGNPLLSALYGGVLSGFGLTLVFLRGGTTGGTDIIVHILKSKYRRISVGKLLLIIDAFIIAFAGIVFKKWETLLYSAISLYISAFIIDLIVEGGNSAKIVYIISKNPALIASAVSAGIGRGTTNLHASSFFSNTEKSVLMCVVKNYEITKLKNIIKNADNLAFVILSDAREVLGNGFENY